MMILLGFLFWRGFLFGIALWASLYPFVPRFPYADIYFTPSKLPQWIWAWANFDGVHYLTIAHVGYAAQFTQAFFPLYPILLKIFGTIVNDRQFILTGIVLSGVCFFGALFMLRELLRLDFDESVVLRTLTWVVIFPTSYYFAGLYTEALFLFLTIAAFLAARKGHWYISGISGALASATRVTGIFLLPALLYEWNRSYALTRATTDVLDTRKKNKIHAKNNIFNNLLDFTINAFRSPVLYVVPLGLFAYMAYLQIAFGDAFYFWHAQSVFGAARASETFILPPQVVWRYVKILTSVPIGTSAYFVAACELIFFLAAVLLLTSAHKMKLRLSYLIFSWCVVLAPVLTGTLSSFPRYMIAAFPIFIVLAKIRNRPILLILSCFSVMLLILLTLNFIRGTWVA